MVENTIAEMQDALPNSTVEESQFPDHDIHFMVEEEDIGKFFGQVRRRNLNRDTCFRDSADDCAIRGFLSIE